MLYTMKINRIAILLVLGIANIIKVSINASLPLGIRSTQERYLPKFSATSDVRYCVLKPIVPYAAVLVRPSERYIEQKQTKYRKPKISNMADNVGII